MSTAPRIAPLQPSQMNTDQKALVGGFSDMVFSQVLVKSPELFRVFIPLLSKLIAGTALTPRERQVIILRTLELCEDVYEATHHGLISKSAGLSDEVIADMRVGQGPNLTEFEVLLAKAVEQLVRNYFIDDATWAALAERYDEKQLMDVLVLTGTYVTMAMLTRNCQMPLEDDSTFHGFAKTRSYI